MQIGEEQVIDAAQGIDCHAQRVQGIEQVVVGECRSSGPVPGSMDKNRDPGPSAATGARNQAASRQRRS